MGLSLRASAVLLILGLLGSVSAADSVEIEPVRDTTLIEDPMGELSNGSGPFVFAGRTGNAGNRRALLKFNVAAELPQGARITSVALTLHMSKTTAGPQRVSLHPVLAAWGEADSFGLGGSGVPSEPGDATWVHTFYEDGFWAHSGGDFAASSASTLVDGIDFYTWGSTRQMVRDVQGWLGQPATNHGWLLRGNEMVANTTKRFDSRETDDAGAHPVLRIEFIPPQGGDDSGIGLPAARRQR